MKSNTIILVSCILMMTIAVTFAQQSQKLATIQLKINSLSKAIPLCTGLILSSNLILARANCLVILSQQLGYSPLKQSIAPPLIHSSLLSVQVDPNTQKKVYHVELHDHFNLFTLDSNLALLMLQSPSDSNYENAQQTIRTELQHVLQEFEKNQHEMNQHLDANLVMLPSLEKFESFNCLKDHSNSRSTSFCKQITYSGAAESLEDSMLFHASKDYPIGIQSFHESNQHNHKLFFTKIGEETRAWFGKLCKQLELNSFETAPLETYHLSPVEDKRSAIMSEIQQRLSEIINQSPSPQKDSSPKTRFSSNSLYETENNLKEISKQLHSQLVNTILGL